MNTALKAGGHTVPEPRARHAVPGHDCGKDSPALAPPKFIIFNSFTIFITFDDPSCRQRRDAMEVMGSA